MRYFLDTEFIEDGHTIALLSIGIVAEDGREYYAESAKTDRTKASEWVHKNVLPHLYQEPRYHSQIKREIVEFIGDDPKPEFWGYYADYDWVALCQLYGTMMQLPKAFPRFCMDLKQLAVMAGNPELPDQTAVEHNALADARWNAEVYEFLQARLPTARSL